MKSLIILCLAFLAVCTALPVTQNKDVSWMDSGKFEGDMVLDAQQMAAVLGLGPKNGLVDERYRWPDNTVPYVIVGGYFNQKQIDYIHKSVQEFAKVSCVTVRPKKDTDKKYVQITGQNSGCFSSVGFQNGVQTLNLAPNVPEVGCFRAATIQHEFLHAIGFYHMQSASDRDDYVTIMWNNITPGSEHNFNLYTASQVTAMGVPYDYGSVMHYGAYGFSKNGEKTIVTKDPNAEIGQRVKMSDKDIQKLNLMYCQKKQEDEE